MGVDREKASAEETARKAMAQNDRDRDRRLSRREVPTTQLQYFDAADADKDGYVSLEELTGTLERRPGK
jgi:Ca2+-binding EF-hand superfamily protein